MLQRTDIEKATKSFERLEQWLHWLAAEYDQASLHFGHGTDSAWDEAVQSLLFVTGLPVDSGEEVLDVKLDPEQREKLVDLALERIYSHRPLPYLTHQAWFAGLEFYVDERVLIPRSPFAEWISHQFSPWIEAKQVKNVIEIGTGSGCMAIATALAFPKANVDAVDISGDALAVAQINVDHYQLGDRVRLIESDGFDSVPEKTYDVIISNPPYVGDEEMDSLPQEYRHEPDGALRAENEGLAIVEKLLLQAKTYLSPTGIVMMEVGNSDELLQHRYPDAPFTWLEQEQGGHGLFVLTAEQLRECWPSR